MITILTYLLFGLAAGFVLQQLILAIFGMSFIQKPVSAVNQYRRIALLIFSDKFQGNLRQTLINLLEQDYPRDKYNVILISSSKETIDANADLTVKTILTTGSNRVSNCRQALSMVEGVYDIAISIHQPLTVDGPILKTVNESFQQGSYFMQPWLNLPERECEIIPEPVAGFQSMGISLPLNNMIYSTPFLWLRQQVEQMNDIENYHHGIQYRLLEQGNTFKLINGVVARLDENAEFEKRGIINRIMFGIKGLRLLFTGKPSMLFIGFWNFHPRRIALIPALCTAGFFNSGFYLIAGVYLLSCLLIMVKHPLFNGAKAIRNFGNQFALNHLRLRKTHAAIEGAQSQDNALMILTKERDFKLAPPINPPSTSGVLNKSAAF